jgi:hypothetical protein
MIPAVKSHFDRPFLIIVDGMQASSNNTNEAIKIFTCVLASKDYKFDWMPVCRNEFLILEACTSDFRDLAFLIDFSHHYSMDIKHCSKVKNPLLISSTLEEYL